LSITGYESQNSRVNMKGGVRVLSVDQWGEQAETMAGA
jgi:hypothetical protein